MTLFQKVVEAFRPNSPTIGVAGAGQIENQAHMPLPPDPNAVFNFPENQNAITITQVPLFKGLHEFDIHRTLGTGSYGRVLLVRHKDTNIFYALKKLSKSEIVRLRQVEHTNNECRLLKLTSAHPFIVGLRGTFQDGRSLYLLLDYVPGGELFTLLRKLRTLPAFVAQFYAGQVALTLSHLHSQGILYRDLKPENLLIHRNGYLRLADFGFAKQLPLPEGAVTWTFCGTPEYLAPEIILATEGYGAGADWWALGVLIYEMLIGQPPFFHENHKKLYDLIVYSPLQFPPSFDHQSKDLISRLLEKDVTKRLGVLVNSANGVLTHPWFKGVDWDQMIKEQLRPPYKPKVSADGDASNFDVYPEEQEVLADEIDQYYYDKFPDFPIVHI